MALQILLELEASGVKPASRDNSQLRPQDGGANRMCKQTMRQMYATECCLRFKERDYFEFDFTEQAVFSSLPCQSRNNKLNYLDTFLKYIRKENFLMKPLFASLYHAQSEWGKCPNLTRWSPWAQFWGFFGFFLMPL